MNEREFSDRAKKLKGLRWELLRAFNVSQMQSEQFVVEMGLKDSHRCDGYGRLFSIEDIAGKGAVERIESIFREALKARIESLTREIKELEDVSSMEAQGFKKANIIRLHGLPANNLGVTLCIPVDVKSPSAESLEFFYREKPLEARP